jgi:hypothetical protein
MPGALRARYSSSALREEREYTALKGPQGIWGQGFVDCGGSVSGLSQSLAPYFSGSAGVARRISDLMLKEYIAQKFVEDEL